MTAKPLLPLRPAQMRAANPRDNAWVSASAGTGKTKVLTDRVLSLLLSGCPPQKILCLTFTRAAAAQVPSARAALPAALPAAVPAASACSPPSAPCPCPG